jgi:hypothetical protein
VLATPFVFGAVWMMVAKADAFMCMLSCQFPCGWLLRPLCCGCYRCLSQRCRGVGMWGQLLSSLCYRLGAQQLCDVRSVSRVVLSSVATVQRSNHTEVAWFPKRWMMPRAHQVPQGYSQQLLLLPDRTLHRQGSSKDAIGMPLFLHSLPSWDAVLLSYLAGFLIAPALHFQENHGIIEVFRRLHCNTHLWWHQRCILRALRQPLLQRLSMSGYNWLELA